MLKKSSFGLFCITLIMLAGCKKENTPVVSPQPRSVGPCYAYQDVVVDSLASELNKLVNCDPQYCEGTVSGGVDYTSSNLVNPITGLPWTFYSDGLVSQADQDAVVQEAKNYAIANNPAGYFVAYFTFLPAFYYEFPSAIYSVRVAVRVRYRQCTAGGGGQG